MLHRSLFPYTERHRFRLRFADMFAKLTRSLSPEAWTGRGKFTHSSKFRSALPAAFSQKKPRRAIFLCSRPIKSLFPPSPSILSISVRPDPLQFFFLFHFVSFFFFFFPPRNKIYIPSQVISIIDYYEYYENFYSFRSFFFLFFFFETKQAWKRVVAHRGITARSGHKYYRCRLSLGALVFIRQSRHVLPKVYNKILRRGARGRETVVETPEEIL